MIFSILTHESPPTRYCPSVARLRHRGAVVPVPAGYVPQGVADPVCAPRPQDLNGEAGHARPLYLFEGPEVRLGITHRRVS